MGRLGGVLGSRDYGCLGGDGAMRGSIEERKQDCLNVISKQRKVGGVGDLAFTKREKKHNYGGGSGSMDRYCRSRTGVLRRTYPSETVGGGGEGEKTGTGGLEEGPRL